VPLPSQMGPGSRPNLPSVCRKGARGIAFAFSGVTLQLAVPEDESSQHREDDSLT